jgi:asparagine synthetase B (glutamine-hydrolysing)
MFKELEKQNIRYIFTGDGPDELFGGYKRIDEYDSQLSDIFYELSFYHFPRLNKLAKHFGLILKTPWVDEEIVKLAINLEFEDRKHKQILKDNFKNIIPDEIINREKRPLKNDLIKENKISYRKKLVKLFYELMEEGENNES